MRSIQATCGTATDAQQQFGLYELFNSFSYAVYSVFTVAYFCHCFVHLCTSVLYYRSPRWPLAVFVRFVTTGCSPYICCTILSFSFSLLYFCFDIPRSLLASLTDHLISHHTILPANCTLASTVPRSPPCSSLLDHAPFASAVFFLLLFVLLSGHIKHNAGPPAFALCTLNIRSILYPRHSAAFSDLTDTHNPDFSVSLKYGLHPLPPLLNFSTARLHTTPWSALPVFVQTRSRPLAVAQLSLSANLSHSYPPLFPISHYWNHLLSL